MPVVELDYSRLKRLVGKQLSKKRIIDTLPYLGLDIEGYTASSIRVEYSPNRPDYSTDYGIAMSLQGLLGIKRGIILPRVRNTKNYKIQVDASVSGIRPYVTGIVAKNSKIDENTLRQIISMQEDLHLGLGRKRRVSSIGIHDLDKISFPLCYTTTDKSHRFVPLHSDKKLSIHDILHTSQVGIDYGHILDGSSQVPLITDAKNNTVSFPPVINAASTTVTTKTRNLFVEVTGLHKNAVEDVLSVISTILHGARFDLYQVQISGAGNSTPQFKQRKIKLDTRLVNSTLGVDMSAATISASLRKSRLGASVLGGKIECIIPRYRFDIIGPMDIVEEVALGYGIANIKPVLSPSRTIGGQSTVSSSMQYVRSIMTGFGYTEIVNSGLTSKKILYDDTMRDSSGLVSVIDSKSLEHTVLRDALLPGLIDTLARNVHESYPQKLFELGTVFGRTADKQVSEETRLCAVSSHADAGFSEIKSVLQSVIKLGFNATCSTRTGSVPIYELGRAARVVSDGIDIGTAGEVSRQVRDRFRLREPVASFEISLGF